jgi:hypothetical protein
MKICGTERRPLREIISARFSAADSTSISLMAAPWSAAACARARSTDTSSWCT